MAGEWIKISIDTANKPEVLRMSRLLQIDRDTVIGKLIRVWGWFDRNSVDGVVDGTVDEDLDDLAICNGFAAAMRQVGWLQGNGDGSGLSLPNFGRHNGETAKTRALKAERQAKWRSKPTTPKSTAPSTPASTQASTGKSTREEKRREDKESKSHSRKRAADPRAQHPAIQTVRKVRERYPPKELWDEMIVLLGDEPLEELLAHCFKEWVRLGFSRENYNWVFEWYPNGGPTERHAKQSASDENFRRRVESETLLAQPRGS